MRPQAYQARQTEPNYEVNAAYRAAGARPGKRGELESRGKPDATGLSGTSENSE